MNFPFEPLDPDTHLKCSIAAAVLGAGAIGAGASIYGANTAANAQTNAANLAIQNSQNMFGQAKGAVQPFIDAGSNALGGLTSWLNPNDPNGVLSALKGLTTPGADQSATLAQTPGYQFNLSQGTRAAQNALAARGLGGSAAVGKGIADYTSGLAGNTWQSVVNSLQNLFSSGSGAMQNLVNSGAGSAQSLAGNAINTGGQISNSLIGAGNAQAGAATATGNALGSFGNSISTAAILQKLLGGSGATGGLYSIPGAAGQFTNSSPFGGISIPSAA